MNTNTKRKVNTVGTAAMTTWSYEPKRDILTQVKNVAFGAVASQFDYENDALGRRVSKNDEEYSYNIRSELIGAATNEVNQYAYEYDDIGNRLTSFDVGTNRTYTANELNQYTGIAEGCQTFAPLFDLDGNQTNILTSTGVWSVTYNGENRPVLWTCGTTNITMKFDRMGRRVEYIETDGAATNKHWKFVYNGYLCLQRLNGATNAITDIFEWDPTEPVATRQLYWQTRDGAAKHNFYLHDGNKNIANVISYQRATGVVASYDYAPFGAVTSATGPRASANSFRFSSEFHDDTIGLVYYNYRHYDPTLGRWLSRDSDEERGSVNLYLICNCVYQTDVLGKNRYITQFDILNLGDSGGTQLHVGVAVDRWKCQGGQWVQNGITTFDFSIDWVAPWYNYILGAIWKARGRIASSPGLNLTAPITLRSCPPQDVKMYLMIIEEMKNPPFYNWALHNCLIWSVGAVNYGMSENCND